MKKILLDTNILLVPERFKVDIFAELNRICMFKYDTYVLKQTVEELEKIVKEAKMKDRIAARVGLGLIKAKDLKIVNQKEGYTDDIIVELAKERFIIVTLDQNLKRRLKAINAPHITLRQKKHLIFIDNTDYE